MDMNADELLVAAKKVQIEQVAANVGIVAGMVAAYYQALRAAKVPAPLAYSLTQQYNVLLLQSILAGVQQAKEKA